MANLVDTLIKEIQTQDAQRDKLIEVLAPGANQPSPTAALTTFAIGIALVYIVTVVRTAKWPQDSKFPPLKGLALPVGSIRGILAFSVIWSFIVFVFYGTQLVSNSQNYTAILTAFGTLTGAVTGFYFGGRSSASPSTAKQSATKTPPLSSRRDLLIKNLESLANQANGAKLRAFIDAAAKSPTLTKLQQNIVFRNLQKEEEVSTQLLMFKSLLNRFSDLSELTELENLEVQCR